MPRKSLHPTFRKKHVVQLNCIACGQCVCKRGMKAILLADTAVELYSTDFPPSHAIDLVNEAYSTEKCRCKVRDVACLGCGSVIGYTVVRPCKPCLESCNNGHLWMYHSQTVEVSDRLDRTGMSILQWGDLIDGFGCDTTEWEDEAMECLR